MRAEAPLRERDLTSELRIAKMYNRQMFEYYCTKTAGNFGERK